MPTLPSPIQKLLDRARETPHAPWLHQSIDGVWRAYSWKECADEVLRFAAALKAQGIAKGDAVAIAGRNTAHWFMADLAVGAMGGISIGLYPKQSAEHTRYILAHSEAKAIVVGPMMDAQEFMDSLPAGIKTIRMPYPDAPACTTEWETICRDVEPLAAPVALNPDTLLTLIYTSGTTGHPKGVMITLGNVQFSIAGLLKVLPARPEGEIFFSYLPLAHAFERGAVELASIYLGAQVYFLEHLDKLAEQLAFVAPTRFYGVPLVYTRIQAGILKKMPQEKLDRVLKIPILSGIVKRKLKKAVGIHRAMIFSGAAPCPKPLMEWFAKLDIQLLQGYGMTENNIYATVNTPSANRIGSAGREMPNAQMKISESGEILFKHGGVMAGYYKEPEKTRETFTEDGYLRTGDKGQVDADGYLFITGRVKDIFKTLKGKYVAPAPIEGAMSRNTDIEQLCFVGAELKQPIMLVALNAAGLKKPREEVEKALIADMQAVNSSLEPHEQIAKIVIVKEVWSIDNGLMTPTMKVKREQIEKRYRQLLDKEGETRSKLVWEA